MSEYSMPGMPPYGKTYYGLNRTIDSANLAGEHLLGARGKIDDYDSAVTNTAARGKRSNTQRSAIYVRNTSGGTLAAGLPVKWAALGFGKNIAGAVGDNEEFAGVVDEMLTAAVRDDDCFWLIVGGPCLVTKALALSVTDGDFLASGAGVPKVAATLPVDGSLIGRAIETDAGTKTSILTWIGGPPILG